LYSPDVLGGTPPSKPEFPPLLEKGRHQMSLLELRELCVNAFPLSTTRLKIMDGLEKIVEKLRSNSIQGEIWVDGSFVTAKIDPEDADLVLRCPADFYENSTQKQRGIVDWLSSNLRNTYLCDSYCFMEWPKGHQNYWVGEYMYSYWMKQFGFSRVSEMKGIAVVALLGGTQ
jgi:hypothetical protein